MNRLAACTAIAIVTVCSGSARAGSFERTGLAWKLDLEHEEVLAISVALNFVPDPDIQAALRAGWGYVELIDRMGGNKGVTITGVLPTAQYIVTPKGQGPYKELVELGDKLSQLGPHWAGIAKGNIKKADGWLVKNDPGRAIGDIYLTWRGERKKTQVEEVWDPGVIATDRKEIGEWERFRIICLGKNDPRIAIQSHTGFLCAQDGYSYAVRSHRAHFLSPNPAPIPDPKENVLHAWEAWTIEKVDDVHVRLKASSGRYLMAQGSGGPGRFCEASRIEKTDDAKFEIRPDKDGYVTIVTNNGTYLTALPR